MTLLDSGSQGGSTNGNPGSGTGDAGGNGSSGGGAPGGSQGNPPGSTGGEGKSWRDTLPEDIRGNATLSKYSDLNSLAKAHIELQGFVGKKGVFPPGEKATPEQWKEFAKTIGQPELEKFEVKTPDGKKVNPEVVNGFKKMAHDSGLLPHQAQGLLDWYLGQEEAQTSAKTKQIEDTTKANIENLRKEWGEGFEKEIAKARLAVKEIGGDEFQKYLEESGLGNDVNIVKYLSKAGALLGEDKLHGEGTGGKFGQTPGEIQNEINKIFADKKHPYFDRSSPLHGSAVKQMEGYFKSLNKRGS